METTEYLLSFSDHLILNEIHNKLLLLVDSCVTYLEIEHIFL